MPRASANLNPDKVRRLIVRAGLSQTELAHRAEIDPTTLSKAMSAKTARRRLSGPALSRIASALECSVDDLLDDDEPVGAMS